MKKQLLLVTVIFSLLLSNVFSQTVYVTNTGKKYHADGCQYLRKSQIAIDLQVAINKGYGACSKCSPPTNVSTSPQKVTPTSPNYQQKNNNNSNDKSSGSVQCSATTKAGTQCKRMTKSSNGMCWQHGGN